MNNNGQPAELAGSAAGADIEEADLESLGLGLFDVDAELAECLENYPEWNVSDHPIYRIEGAGYT